MKKITEQEMAKNYLAHRDREYSIGYVLRKSMRRYALHLGVTAVLVVGSAISEDLCLKGFCLWGFGMFFGALCRDFGWLRRIKKTWPFTRKVVDWQKVEEFARGEGE